MNTSWMAATLLVFALALWMLSGVLRGDGQSDDEQDADSAQETAMTVEAMPAATTTMAREIELHGQLEPVQHLLLNAQTDGSVEKIHTSKGSRVRQQDELLQLDLGSRMATLAEAKAAVKLARSEQRAAKALNELELQSQLQLEQAEASLEAAMARQASISLDIEKTTITAPFDAVVNDILVDSGELIDRGAVVIELIDDSAFKVSAQASQQVLSELSAGQAVKVSLITGETLDGSLSYVSSIADPQTRTFTVEATVENPGAGFAAGVSATLHIPVEEVEATFISPSTLSLGNDGQLGIKALDNQDRVEFLPIELISTTVDGAWVSGIPEGQRVITIGQGFVNPGELVNAQAPAER
ncbi:MAG: efflux RND transporter periplasmic adaptor subunit [Granulosicoccus sp.]|nr:efflux RND transporter periplasmic adaptor subunit [Granulosicoccus sp.]